MKGARELCKFFPKAVQIERLYILPHYHARGKTLRIYVLPEGEKVIENAGINPPLNNESVEVFGVIGGQPGWTEEYGWIHTGPWVDDFYKIVKDREASLLLAKDSLEKLLKDKKAADQEKVNRLLGSYS